MPKFWRRIREGTELVCKQCWCAVPKALRAKGITEERISVVMTSYNAQQVRPGKGDTCSSCKKVHP